MCRFSCPTTNAEFRETVTPTVKMNLLQLMRNGTIDFTPEVAEIFYHCTGCRSCRSYCKHRTDVPAILEFARSLAVARGLEPEAITSLMRVFAESRNPFGDDLKEKLASIKAERYINKSAEILYFPGCVTLNDDPALASKIVTVLEKCGADFAVYGNANQCCGIPALLAGDKNSFAANAKELAKVLNSYKTIISGCPACLATFSEKYEDAGATITAKIMHITEYAADKADTGRLQFLKKSKEKVMYHDPCYMTKYLGVVESPRALLDKVYYHDNILEFSQCRDKTYCCGGGGLYSITAEEASKAITNERLGEFREQKPDMLITSCPSCERAFRKADPSIKVKDVIDVLLDCLQ